MKYELHIPVEQYGFVAATLDTEDVSEIRTAYEQIRSAFKTGEGIAQKEWNAVVDQALAGTLKLAPDLWEQMSQYQQSFLHEIKKSKNRN